MLATKVRQTEVSGDTDPNFANVSLLLHMDGTNGSTTFTDKSNNALTVTASGNAQISTTQSKFGGSSAYFDGNDYATLPTNNVLAFPGAFTVEFWIRLDSIPSSPARVILYTGDSSGSYILRLESSTGYIFSEQNFFSTNLAKTNVGLTANTWQHVAVCRDSSNVMRTFIDGSQYGNQTVSANFSSSGGAIFASTSGTQGLTGYIDDLRITKGVARYTANFTAPASAFPDS